MRYRYRADSTLSNLFRESVEIPPPYGREVGRPLDSEDSTGWRSSVGPFHGAIGRRMRIRVARTWPLGRPEPKPSIY